jgi:hypothetical protein
MTESQPTASCVTCGQSVADQFCPSCGERRLTPKDERLGVFLKEQFQEAFSADGKLWRTFKALFVPGRLTVAYMEGRRSFYVRPIRVFLFMNVVLFLLLRGSSQSVLKGPLASSFDALVYGGLARRMAESRASAWPGGMDSFSDAFNQHSAGLAPTLIVTLIPFVALVLLVNRPRGAGVRHLVLATHAVSTMIALVLLIAVTLVIGLFAAWSFGWIESVAEGVDPLLVPTVTLLFSIYFCFSIRRVYGLRLWIAAISGGLTATVGFSFAFWIYRAVLFWISLWTLGAP